MKKEVENHILSVFCEHHNSSTLDFMDNLKQLVSETYAPFLLFTECLNSDDFKARNNPCDGFFINMLHRASNVFAAMANLIASGHLQEAEILARPLAESSLKIMHLCKGNAANNLAIYLASYFDESSSKIKKWNDIDSKSDGNPHNKLIRDKVDTENILINICRNFIKSTEGIWPEKIQSITVEKLFKDLEKEIEYRTVYRAMCGSSHQNPEDIVLALVSAVADSDEMDNKRIQEKHCFSILICLWGVRYHLESIVALSKYFSFESVRIQTNVALATIGDMHTSINSALTECQFPSGWSKNTIDGV